MGRIKEVDRKRVRHDKVRTGCDQCKSRRIKCPEDGDPCRRCTIAKLTCTFTNLPKRKDSNTEVQDKSHVGLPRTRSTSDGEDWTGHWTDDLPEITWSDSSTASPNSWQTYQAITPFTQAVTSRRTSKELEAIAAVCRSPSESLYANTFETTAYEFHNHWLKHYTSPRSQIPVDIWLQRIHQHAHYFPPLRDLVVAMGSIGLSLARGDDSSTHLSVLQKGHRYTHSAINALSTTRPPTIVMLYCAWIFWQLDLIRGELATSYMHVMSAKRIAAEATTVDQIDPRELAGLFGIGAPDWFGIDMTILPDAFLPNNPPIRRKRCALVLVRNSSRDLSDMILDVSVDRTILVTDGVRNRILDVLEEARGDLEWLLRKWNADVVAAEPDPNEPEEFGPAKWEPAPMVTDAGFTGILAASTSRDASLASDSGDSPDSTSSVKRSSKRASIVSLFKRSLDMVRESRFSPKAVAEFRMYCLQFVPQIVVLVAQTDLGMRHDEFLLVSRAANFKPSQRDLVDGKPGSTIDEFHNLGTDRPVYADYLVGIESLPSVAGFSPLMPTTTVC